MIGHDSWPITGLSSDFTFLMVNFSAKFQMEHGERGRQMREG